MKSTKTVFFCATLVGLNMLTGCTKNYDDRGPEASVTNNVIVLFDEDGCVTGTRFNGVDGADPELSAGRRDKIRWLSYDPDDQTGPQKGPAFTVFFTPFRQGSVTSNPNGMTPPRQVGFVPAPVSTPQIPVFYKYTIWGNECTDKPFDPRFKVV